MYITEKNDREKQTRKDLCPQNVVTSASLHAGDSLSGGNEERRRPSRPAAVNLEKYTVLLGYFIPQPFNRCYLI